MFLRNHHIAWAASTQRGAFNTCIKGFKLTYRHTRHIGNLLNINRAAEADTRQCTTFVWCWQLYTVTFAVLENVTQCQHFRYVNLCFLWQ
ncbi:Uncharacterised protein [Enterobacter cloacae]|nr:Uncharacterised protein [Enterobacter cloacae]